MAVPGLTSAFTEQEGGAKAYEKCALEQLPPDISAAGFGVSVYNTLTSTIPVEFAVQVTGHDLKGVSAFYEYLRPYFALLMPGAIVLAGWPAFAWGTTGLGPRPASLAPIYALGVDAALLQTMIVAVFNLDSASPPEFQPAGSLWPLITSFVSISLWFEHRAKCSQMEKLIRSLRHSTIIRRSGPGREPPNWRSCAGARPSTSNSTPITST